MEADDVSGSGLATFCGFLESSEVTCTAQTRNSNEFGGIATKTVYLNRIDTNAETSGKSLYCRVHIATSVYCKGFSSGSGTESLLPLISS